MANLKRTMQKTVRYLERLLLERDRAHALDLVFPPAHGDEPGWLLMADGIACCSGSLAEARELTADGGEAFLHTLWDAVIAKERDGLLSCSNAAELAQRRAREHSALIAAGKPAEISKRVLEIGYPAWLMRGAASPFHRVKRPVDAWGLAEELGIRPNSDISNLFLLNEPHSGLGYNMRCNARFQTGVSVGLLQAELDEAAYRTWENNPDARVGLALSLLTWYGSRWSTIFINGVEAIIVPSEFAKRCLATEPFMLLDVLKKCLKRFDAEGFAQAEYEKWSKDVYNQAKWPSVKPQTRLHPNEEPLCVKLWGIHSPHEHMCEFPGDSRSADSKQTFANATDKGQNHG